MNLPIYIEKLKKLELLNEKEIRNICEKAKEILIEENNVQPVFSPVTICGDIHGQFYDLLELFAQGGQIPENKYVFMGDYVDRGYNSIETISLLLCLKLQYPDCITLIRGNHETRAISMNYGFYDEVYRKYGNCNVYRCIVDVFDYLPLAVIVDETVLCVHGGLSPDLQTIDKMRVLNRNIEIPNEGPYCDLVWSDPLEIETWRLSDRGAGWYFGKKVVEEFNFLNNLSLICRSHQLVMEGYQYWFDEKLITVWSAPNYCYRCGNYGMIMKVDENLQRNFVMFKDSSDNCKNVPLRNINIPYFL